MTNSYTTYLNFHRKEKTTGAESGQFQKKSSVFGTGNTSKLYFIVFFRPKKKKLGMQNGQAPNVWISDQTNGQFYEKFAIVKHQE